MHLGTIDFYHFIPVLLTVTMAVGHKVSTQQNLLASFSHTLQSFRLFLDIMGPMTHGYAKWWVNFQKDGTMTI